MSSPSRFGLAPEGALENHQQSSSAYSNSVVESSRPQRKVPLKVFLQRFRKLIVLVFSKLLEKFTLFTKLPKELRTMIWTDACRVPSKVQLEHFRWIPKNSLPQMKLLEEITIFRSLSCQFPYPSRYCINASPDEQLYQRVRRRKESDFREILMDEDGFIGDREVVRRVEMDLCRNHPDNIYRNHLDLRRNWDDCLPPYEG
ncbi:hypothetical protein DL95DRAFT_464799 [Leptodontidium sp. 2 PMI_412]|nr:hypothetical protein DL95DRAFT_464799 [Leptodontidium sp. 2 PMI_412]